MAIAFDAASSWTSGNPVTSLNIAITVGSGSNRILFCLALTTGSNPAATWKGTAMTIVKQIAGTGFDSRYWTLFALENPTSGSDNVVVTASSGVIQGAASCYTGASQTVTMDASDSSTQASVTSITGTLTTVADNCWQIFGARFANNNISAGTGATQRAASTFSGLFDSNGAKTPAGSTSMTANSSGAAGGAYQVMVSFAPAGTAHTKTLTETATLVDTIIKAPSRVLSEVTTLVDTLLKQGQKVLTEAITLADTVLRQAGRTLSEVVRTTEYKYRVSTNGTSDYIDPGNDTVLDIPSGGAFTFVGKIKTTDTRGPIVSFRNSGQDGAVIDICVGMDGVVTDNGKLLVLVRQDNGGGGYARVSGGTINDGNLHSWALTRGASSSTIELWLDGVSQGTASGAESGGAITTNLRAFGSERRWTQDGISEVDRRFLAAEYNRVRMYMRKLTNAQIGEHHSDQFTDNSNLVLAYNFREGSGSTTKDVSKSGNTGTLNGCTWVAELSGVTKATYRILAEVATLVDTVLKQSSRTLTETITLVDTVIKQGSRTLSEVATLVDTVIKTTGRTLTEVVTLTDTFIRTVSRTLVETVTLVDTFIRDMYKTFTESLTLTDILTTVYSGVARIGNIILRTKKEPKSTLPTNKKD